MKAQELTQIKNKEEGHRYWKNQFFLEMKNERENEGNYYIIQGTEFVSVCGRA